ncbi:hypothetical protein ZHAS_00014493 [Anopheles sinensis]|uniref:Uncharacterized protein n=1 Tax=Anopheles sinensis TaxID=74873 RepID=A0A084W8F9_ANOSI|nr:hypothetical protein ZHAS_00014493 [Anopheles sinensis]
MVFWTKSSQIVAVSGGVQLPTNAWHVQTEYDSGATSLPAGKTEPSSGGWLGVSRKAHKKKLTRTEPLRFGSGRIRESEPNRRCARKGITISLSAVPMFAVTGSRK